MKQRTGRLLAAFLTLILLSGCGGDPAAVTGPESSAPQAEVKPEVSIEAEPTPDASEGLLFQGPALRLGHDDVFEIYERTAEPGVSHQNYWTKLPYESHSKSMLSYYVETHLVEEAGLTLLRQDETEIESQMLSILFFTHPEAEVIPETDYCLMLAFCEADDGGTEIRIDYSDSLTMEEWDATAQAAPEPEPEPEPEPQSSDPSVLPDFLETGTDYEVSGNTTTHWRIYTADHMDISAVEAYIQQLLDMGYTIVHTEEDPNSFGGVYRCWEFSHTDVDADAINTRGAQVTVESSTYGEWDDQTLDIEFSHDITMDSGSVSSEPSSTGGGYVDCPSCSGGRCTACNGSRGKYSYSPGLDREWEECWKCNGTGKCSRCGGDGQIFG